MSALQEKLKEAYEKFPYETHQLFLRNYFPITVDPFSLKPTAPEESYSEKYTEEEIKLDEELYDKNVFLNAYFLKKAKKFNVSKDARFEKAFGEGISFVSNIIEVSGEASVWDKTTLNSSGLASELVFFIVKKGSYLKHLRYVSGSGNLLYNAYYYLEEGAKVEVFSLAEGKMYIRERSHSFNRGRFSSFSARLGYDLSEASTVDSFSLTKLMAPNASSTVYQSSVVRRYSKALHKGLVVNTKEGVQGNSYISQKALLLSKEASAQNIPGMELEINDIFAKHSAAVFPIDPNQLFYLMSRGLSMDSAVDLIAKNMFKEIRDALNLSAEYF